MEFFGCELGDFFGELGVIGLELSKPALQALAFGAFSNAVVFIKQAEKDSSTFICHFISSFMY